MSELFSVKTIEYPFPAKPVVLSHTQQQQYVQEIKTLLKQNNAVLVAHYYTDPEIQALAEATGGCISDSLEMARFGRDCEADTLIVAGVRFMGETAKFSAQRKKC